MVDQESVYWCLLCWVAYNYRETMGNSQVGRSLAIWKESKLGYRESLQPGYPDKLRIKTHSKSCDVDVLPALSGYMEL